MHGRVITDARQITAGWLTAVLMRGGVLRAGHVRDVGADAEKSVWYVAVEWCVLEEDRTRMRWLWEQQLHKEMMAFFDLRCADLSPNNKT